MLRVLTKQLVDTRSQLFSIYLALIVRDAVLQNCWNRWTRPIQTGVGKFDA